MAHKRASLDASGLVGLKVPLTSSRVHGEPVEVSEGVLDVLSEPTPARRTYSAVDKSDDPLVPYPLQLRLSQVQELRRLKSERGIVPAQLVRDFIAAGLRDLK